MKPTYEYCNYCRAVKQHLNGYCSCYEQLPPSKPKVIKAEYYDFSPEEINNIKDLQKIYSDMLNKTTNNREKYLDINL